MAIHEDVAQPRQVDRRGGKQLLDSETREDVPKPPERGKRAYFGQRWKRKLPPFRSGRGANRGIAGLYRDRRQDWLVRGREHSHDFHVSKEFGLLLDQVIRAAIRGLGLSTAAGLAKARKASSNIKSRRLIPRVTLLSGQSALLSPDRVRRVRELCQYHQIFLPTSAQCSARWEPGGTMLPWKSLLRPR